MTIPDFTAENPVAIGFPLVMVEAANAARATRGVMALAAAKKNMNMCAAKNRNPETVKSGPISRASLIKTGTAGKASS